MVFIFRAQTQNSQFENNELISCFQLTKMVRSTSKKKVNKGGTKDKQLTDVKSVISRGRNHTRSGSAVTSQQSLLATANKLKGQHNRSKSENSNVINNQRAQNKQRNNNAVRDLGSSPKLAKPNFRQGKNSVSKQNQTKSNPPIQNVDNNYLTDAVQVDVAAGEDSFLNEVDYEDDVLTEENQQIEEPNAMEDDIQSDVETDMEVTLNIRKRNAKADDGMSTDYVDRGSNFS